MKLIDNYSFYSDKVPVKVQIVQKDGEYVPLYVASISDISKSAERILEKVREETINEVKIDVADLGDIKKRDFIKKKFEEKTKELIIRYFPDSTKELVEFFTSFVIQKSMGLGDVDLLKNDELLEEITINGSSEPVWVYHRKYGWLKTNIILPSEQHIHHLSTTIGRDVGRQINMLEPLMDASLDNGDRVNATLMPVSNRGNTITIRKFSKTPWTIASIIKAGTISASGAALVWLGIQYEMSALISGGTGSGKTSVMNAISNLFPPNQRIISIEDTRELTLPDILHWVPMMTRLPNAEGKGEVTMLDLLVNSLRMRPDRIVVGEIRRKEEAEVLFEAIHTGHSVYATIHANDARETISRLVNPPINLPKMMLPALSMIIVQNRNRRTGQRRTFQIAEVTSDGEANVLQQLDLKSGQLMQKNRSQTILDTLTLHVGLSEQEMKQDLAEKEELLKWLVKNDITDVHEIGRTIAEYYFHNKNAS